MLDQTLIAAQLKTQLNGGRRCRNARARLRAKSAGVLRVFVESLLLLTQRLRRLKMRGNRDGERSKTSECTRPHFHA